MEQATYSSAASRLKANDLTNFYNETTSNDNPTYFSLDNSYESFNKRLQRYSNSFSELLNITDSKLTQVYFIEKVSSYLRIRKSTTFLIALFASLFSIQYGLIYNLIYEIIGLYYPAWMTFKSIESSNKTDQVHWLIYWVVFSFFRASQYPIDIFTFWIPFRGVLKLCILTYISFPPFKGSLDIYCYLLRPFLIKHRDTIDKTLLELKANLGDTISSSMNVTENSNNESFSKDEILDNFNQELQTYINSKIKSHISLSPKFHKNID